MNKLRQWWLAGVGVTVLAGVIGAGAAMAQTPSTTPTAATTATAAATMSTSTSKSAAATPSATAPTTAKPGKFVPNEDPAHEAAESPEREAEEDAGIAPSGPPNGAPAAPSSSLTPSSAN